MKKLIIICIFCLAAFLIFKFGFAVGGLLFIVSCLVIFLVWHRVNYLQTIARYAKKYENIYIVSNQPDTDEEIFIEAVDHLIINCCHSGVIETVKDQQQLLQVSKNPFFSDPSLTDSQKLQVIPVIFQDGEFVNESFKQFRKRVIALIEQDRASRHAMLKKADAIWYNKHSNNQRSVQWIKK